MKTKAKSKIDFKEFGIFIVFFALVIILMIISPNAFAQPRNLINIVKQASINGILSCGMMFVIIAGGIDLSAGSTIALAGVMAAFCAQNPDGNIFLPLIAAVLACSGRSSQWYRCSLPESAAVYHYAGNHDRCQRSGADSQRRFSGIWTE